MMSPISKQREWIETIVNSLQINQVALCWMKIKSVYLIGMVELNGMSHLYFNDVKYSLYDNNSFNFLEDLATTCLEGKFNLQ